MPNIRKHLLIHQTSQITAINSLQVISRQSLYPFVSKLPSRVGEGMKRLEIREKKGFMERVSPFVLRSNYLGGAGPARTPSPTTNSFQTYSTL